ncbi:MAG: hypothetical protein HXX18_06975 [Bacteroidetes bacterium]|nr:hypothetical protein [Bacteroidota bacterium]
MKSIQYISNSSSNEYRFGFNGQEKDPEIYNNQSTTTAMFWEYDGRIGRRWNLDPKPQISISDYAVMANNPIFNLDILGDIIDPWWEKDKKTGENNFCNQDALHSFNVIAISLCTSNDVFKRVVNDLQANKTVHYKAIQIGKWNTAGWGAYYDPPSKTINLFSDLLSKSAVFEETFHAGQYNFYGKEKRTSLQLEFEAKVSKIATGIVDDDLVMKKVSKTDFSIIQNYYSGEKTDMKSFNSSLNNVLEATSSVYGGETKGFDKKESLRYLSNIVKNKDKNKGAMDVKKFSNIKE